jgi:nitroimidazol reductase NimA-like FMN-containing flavoprotein (pyridoxamine 5'-phosphate oxidase superfamily)
MTDAWLEELSHETCLRLLREGTVGRIAVVVDDAPVILPVNYRLVEPPSGPLVVVRTRPGNVIEQAAANVAFEIDSIDLVNHRGWSVVVRGELLHAFPATPEARELYEPDPWLTDGRNAWLFVDPVAISGRELHGAEPYWPFRPGDYI